MYFLALGIYKLSILDQWDFPLNLIQFSQDIPCIYLGVTDYDFKNIVFLSLKIDFVIANNANPVEIPRNLGICCLSKYQF